MPRQSLASVPASTVRAFGGGYAVRPIAPPPVPFRGYRLMFVFSVCRLVSRRCHFISAIPFRQDSEQASRGKTCDLPHVDAGFIKRALQRMEDFVVTCPLVPGYATPRIRFLFVAPCFRIGLPSDPASRRRPCPSPSLRLLCVYLRRRLSPRKSPVMPGTHVVNQTLARMRQ